MVTGNQNLLTVFTYISARELPYCVELKNFVDGGVISLSVPIVSVHAARADPNREAVGYYPATTWQGNAGIVGSNSRPCRLLSTLRKQSDFTVSSFNCTYCKAHI